MPPTDPWASDGTKERRRQVRPKRPSLSPLNDVGARPGVATAAGEVVQSGGSNAREDLCLQADESQARSPGATKRGVVKIKLRMVTVIDGQEAEAVDVSVLPKTYDRMEDIGLTLVESKLILKDLQQHIVRRQAKAFVDSRSRCEDCNRRLGSKGSHNILLRTLFGTPWGSRAPASVIAGVVQPRSQRSVPWQSCCRREPRPKCSSWRPNGQPSSPMDCRPGCCRIFCRSMRG